eukprot:COSAG01_NODE_2099_length_8429_cov_228.935414_5_plen_87_part_00
MSQVAALLLSRRGRILPASASDLDTHRDAITSRVVSQVAAMEERAKKVGMGGKLHYIFPSNGGLNPADTIKAKALGIDAQMAADSE